VPVAILASKGFAILSSTRMTDTLTSIIEPVGAVMVHSVEAALTLLFQKEAKEALGGPVTRWAGEAVDTDVSDTSVVLVFPSVEDHSTEQVANAPCVAEGDQIEIWFIFTAAKREYTVEFPTTHTVPAAQAKEFAVIAVAVPLVDVNR
jgi:hypothetical protein